MGKIKEENKKIGLSSGTHKKELDLYLRMCTGILWLSKMIIFLLRTPSLISTAISPTLKATPKWYLTQVRYSSSVSLPY